MPQPIAFVLPRYGLDFVGGAETLARKLAEALYQNGVPVEVLTTCSNTLADEERNDYEPGETTLNGVPVHRFPIGDVDTEQYQQLLEKSAQQRLTYGEQRLFVQHSINSQALYDHLRSHADYYRCCVVGPYLAGTTYAAAQAMPGKTIHLPCLQDERFARYAIFREMLEEAQGILFNSPEEEALARRLGIINPFATVVGVGFEPGGAPNPQQFRTTHGLGDAPFIIYAGRYEESKNVPLLLDYFLRYKREHTTCVKLVMIGTGSVKIPEHPDVVDLGFFRPGTFDDGLAGAMALTQLSTNESFSLVIMESWLQGRPVIVHRNCAATHGQVRRSAGGWAVATYEEFADTLTTILDSPAIADEHGAAGRQYVEQDYSWPATLRRFHEAVDRFTAPRTLYQELSQRGVRRSLEFTSERYAERFSEVIAQALHTARQAPRQVGDEERVAALARVARPEYRVRSGVPVIGRLIVWLRTQLTSHLREPYLDPIVRQQEQYNLAVQGQIDDLTRLVLRHHRGVSKWLSIKRSASHDKAQLDELKARITHLEAELASLRRIAQRPVD